MLMFYLPIIIFEASLQSWTTPLRKLEASAADRKSPT